MNHPLGRLAPGAQNWHGLAGDAGLPLFFASASGAEVVTEDGRRLIDLYCGSGTVILGHAHPAQCDAVARALRSGATVSLRHPVERELAGVLADLFDADHAAFFKTGSEAVHAAVQVALRATGRRKVVTTGYHGWLLPLPADLPVGVEVERLSWSALDPGLTSGAVALADAAALIVSPSPDMVDAGALAGLVDAARRTGAVVIADEVKAGFRRGYPATLVELGVRADLVVLSKALANGFPIAALVGGAALLGDRSRFSVFSTYASEQLSLTAARACLDLLAGGEYERFAKSSSHLFHSLAAELAPYGVTTLGVPTFFGLALPDELPPERVCRGLLDRGVLYHPHDAVIVSAAHDTDVLDRAVEAFVAVAAELTAGAR
jgi:glutamate-1-semialdehyde aminotransferase